MTVLVMIRWDGIDYLGRCYSMERGDGEKRRQMASRGVTDGDGAFQRMLGGVKPGGAGQLAKRRWRLQPRKPVIAGMRGVMAYGAEIWWR